MIAWPSTRHKKLCSFFSHPGSLPFLTPSVGGTECSSFHVLSYWIGQKVRSGCPIISYRKPWISFLVDSVFLSCCLIFHLPWEQAIIFSHLNSSWHCLCSVSSTLSPLLKSHPIPQVWLCHPLYHVLVISEITHLRILPNPEPAPVIGIQTCQALSWCYSQDWELSLFSPLFWLGQNCFSFSLFSSIGMSHSIWVTV